MTGLIPRAFCDGSTLDCAPVVTGCLHLPVIVPATAVGLGPQHSDPGFVPGNFGAVAAATLDKK